MHNIQSGLKGIASESRRCKPKMPNPRQRIRLHIDSHVGTTGELHVETSMAVPIASLMMACT